VRYLYLLRYMAEEREVAEAELWALAGAEAGGERLVPGDSQADIGRAAYVALCVELLAHASSLEALVQEVGRQRLAADQFRIQVLKSTIEGARPKTPPSSLEIARRLADAIQGAPNLSQPRTELACFAQAGDWSFGRIVSASGKGWVAHVAKPHSYSNSLPSRLARALVNLVAAPGEALLDPCCGVGTVLIEAESVGVTAVGCDINKQLVSHARANLLHFGLPARVAAADARHIGGRFDAIVADLPYGWTAPADRAAYVPILDNLCRLAPRAVIVAGTDIRSELDAAGWRIRRLARHGSGRATRRVHICQAQQPGSPKPGSGASL